MNIRPISFKGMPHNYYKIDNTVSRSAQPMIDDFVWLKEQGVTDIINFRTMFKPSINFHEREVVENLGMKYHNIPTSTKTPSVENVDKFLNLVDDIKKNKGKVHIHCMAGADRTGMYSFIYKMQEGMGSLTININDWIEKGHSRSRFPNLIPWALKYIKKLYPKHPPIPL